MSKLQPGVNDLYTWCQNNGIYGQQILSEWTGEIFNGLENYKISEISYGSGKEFIWKCSKGHTWHARVTTRTLKREGCPLCCSIGTSYPEQFIYWSLKQVFPQAMSRGKYKGIEFDIAIPEKKTCIEYSPTKWHEGKEDKDKAKADLCKQYGVNFIYIREDTYNEYDEQWIPNFISFHISTESDSKDKDCIKLVDFILKNLDHSINEVNISKVKQQAYEYSHGKIEDEKSLAHCYPELLKEWHPKLNILKPEQLTKSSSESVYWQCTKCGYGSNGEWYNSVHSRTNKKHKTGCPRCRYNWYDKKVHGSYGNKAIIEGKDDIQSQYPELALEWHPSLNEKKPTEVSKSHTAKIYWKCCHCGYGSNGEWQAKPSRRTAKGYETGCPQCGYNWHRAMTGQPQKLKFPYD